MTRCPRIIRTRNRVCDHGSGVLWHSFRYLKEKTNLQFSMGSVSATKKGPSIMIMRFLFFPSSTFALALNNKVQVGRSKVRRESVSTPGDDCTGQV